MANRLSIGSDMNWERNWHWRECQEENVAVWPNEEPSEPKPGQGWYDASSDCLYMWNGIRWVCVPND